MKIHNLYNKLEEKENKYYVARRIFKKALREKHKEISIVTIYYLAMSFKMKDGTDIHFSKNGFKIFIEFTYNYEINRDVLGHTVAELVSKIKKELDIYEKYLAFGKLLYKEIYKKEIGDESCNLYNEIKKIKGGGA